MQKLILELKLLYIQLFDNTNYQKYRVESFYKSPEEFFMDGERVFTKREKLYDILIKRTPLNEFKSFEPKDYPMDFNPELYNIEE